MFQPMLYGLGKLVFVLYYNRNIYLFNGNVDHIIRMSLHLQPFVEDKTLGVLSLSLSIDQSILDDIEKTINDDMKRIISWLQQLK